MREVFRGIMVNNWVEIKKAADFYCERWNNHCVVLHSPEIKKNLRKKMKEIKLLAMNETIEN